jgi:hypothetical protein
MNANSAQRHEAPVHDEWGIFDPRRAGVPAVIDALRDGRVADQALAADPAPRLEPPQEPVAPQAPRVPVGGGALYTLESPVHCPQCDNEIRTFRVLRVLRTQASFTSTLPRKGYVIVCPECDRILSAELAGLV